MHQTAGSLISGNDRSHFRIIFQSPDVIDKICSVFQGFFRNTSLIGIYRDGDIKTPFYCFDNRKNTLDLLLCANRCMSRTCGFPTDIKNISTFGDHSFCMFQGMVHVVPFSTV